AETIAALRAASKRTIFLSNNPTKTREQYAQKLSHMGIVTPVEDIVNSSFVLVQWLLREAPGATLFVVGEEPLKSDLRAAGFCFSETAGAIDIVVASFDRTFAYHKLQVAFDAIRKGARLIATNPDRYCLVPGGGEPDCAAIIAAIEACTGARCDPIVGKPSPIMVATIMDMLRLPAKRCIVVGDRLGAEIKKGNGAGMATRPGPAGDATRGGTAAPGLDPHHRGGR